MSQQFSRRISVLTAFTCLTLIAMIAWLFGAPILAAVLDIGAVAALIITFTGSKSFKQRM